jgi:flagella basal body P-ring formation protein FlgA
MKVEQAADYFINYHKANSKIERGDVVKIAHLVSLKTIDFFPKP